jgi:uncharacterized protein
VRTLHLHSIWHRLNPLPNRSFANGRVLLRLAPILILALLFSPACKRTDAAPKQNAALELTGAVMDKANLLDGAAEARITDKLLAAHTDYGPQMAVVTTPSLEGKPIETYGLDLANSWRLGDVKRSDGLLLIVAPNERKVRIEVGIGLEGSFNTRFAKAIVDETLTPRFRQGAFQAGIEAAVDRMIAKMKAVPTLPVNDNASPKAKDKAA